MVEQSPHHPKAEGSSGAAGTGREKMAIAYFDIFSLPVSAAPLEPSALV